MVETVGGYDYKYISEVAEDLICSLCHFPFKHPVHIEECGHIYCNECFQQTKDHAEANALDFCCPLDRQKIDVTRVFKDKLHERKIFSLKVECRNHADGCSWTGELRDAIDHEEKCGKNKKLKLERFEVKLKTMSSCLKDLTLQVKCHEQRLEEKDKQIYNQNKQIENYSKHFEDQKKRIENCSKQLEEQHKLIENHKKQMENCNKQIDDQNILIEKQMKQLENYGEQLEDQNVVIEFKNIVEMKNFKMQSNNANQENEEITYLKKQVENINKESILRIDNQSYETEHFGWGLYIEIDKVYVSPIFYNIVNGMCFQLETKLKNHWFLGFRLFITLRRYRGKYDHPTNQILTTQPFELVIHILGNNGNIKVMNFSNEPDDRYTIRESKEVSVGSMTWVRRSEFPKLIVYGYLNIQLFFQ